MSETGCKIIKSSKNFQDKADNNFDKIVIAGGGLAAFFTAYEILKQAKEAGRELSVLLVAEKISSPCTAGSHVVLELEGMFHGQDANACADILRHGFNSLKGTIEREKIDCRFKQGYEVKGRTAEELDTLVKDMLEHGVYKASEIKANTDNQTFKLPGYDHSVSIDTIGQVNMPELLLGMMTKIEAMGGRVLEGARYEGQSKDENGNYIVHTSAGDYTTRSKPVLATGAEHQRSLKDFNFKAEVVHTMGLVLGPLSKEDAAMMSNGPMAICDTVLDGDVLWGGIDEKGFFTLGRGDLKDASHEERDKLYQEIVDLIESKYPGLTKKYPPEVSFGAMLVPENKMPIVGRLQDYDVMGGWAGMGVVAGYAAAQAYAKWIISGDDADLRTFEAMQPGGFPDASITRGGDNAPAHDYKAK